MSFEFRYIGKWSSTPAVTATEPSTKASGLWNVTPSARCDAARSLIASPFPMCETPTYLKPGSCINPSFGGASARCRPRTPAGILGPESEGGAVPIQAVEKFWMDGQLVDWAD